MLLGTPAFLHVTPLSSLTETPPPAVPAYSLPPLLTIDKTTPTVGEPMRAKELPPSVLLYTPSPLDPA